MIEIKIDIDEKTLFDYSQKERQDFQTNLFILASTLTADYGAKVDWSDSFHWIIQVPEAHEKQARLMLKEAI